jgi:hypothetical protein
VISRSVNTELVANKEKNNISRTSDPLSAGNIIYRPTVCVHQDLYMTQQTTFLNVVMCFWP